MENTPVRMTALQQALYAARDNKEVGVLNVLRKDLDTAALITKLEKSTRTPFRYDEKNNILIDIPNRHGFMNKAENIVSRIIAAEHLRSMLPETELISQILISSILAPKDFITTELSLFLDANIYSPKLLTSVKAKLEDFFEESYKIKDRLYTYLDDALFNTGSKPVLVLPENVIDDIINAKSNFSMEALRTEFQANGQMVPHGILGPGLINKDGVKNDTSKTFAFEDFSTKRQIQDYDEIVYSDIENPSPSLGGGRAFDTGVRITDNINILKIDRLNNILSEVRTKEVINSRKRSGIRTSLSLESRTIANGENFSMTDREMVELVYSARNRSSDTVRVIKTQSQLERRSITEPLILELPSESVIPVFVPGNVERHVGYIILIDDTGNPLTRHNMPTLTNDALNGQKNSTFVRNLIAKTNYAMNGTDFSCNDPTHVRSMINVFGNVIEADLMARLRNGTNSRSARLARNEELYRIMVARKLEGNNTRMLWAPKELLTYFCVDYDNAGVGVSMIIRNETVGAMRAGLMFADVGSAIRNSAGQTIYDVQLDEGDPNPEKTVELIKGLAMASRQSMVPFQASSPAETADFINRAGVFFKFSGNSKIPEMTIDKTESNSNHSRPDPEMLEYLTKTWAMGFSITPEILDSVHQPELATVAFNQNVLLTKRVVQLQDLLNPQITDHARIVSRHHDGLISDLISLLEENFDDIIMPDNLKEMANKSEVVKREIIELTIRDTIESMELQLSQPELASTDSKINELTTFEEMLDKKLESYFGNESMVAEIFGELADKAPIMRDLIKNSLMRQEMDRMNLGGDITELFNVENGELKLQSMVLEHSTMAKQIVTTLAHLFKENKEFKKASNDAVQALDADADADYESGSGGDGTGGPDEDPDMSDFGLGDELGGEGGEESTEETSEEEGGDGEPPVDLGDQEPLTF